MQKTFRNEGLERWPKISAKEPVFLRDFAYFLQGCRDAMIHIPGHSILNDCTENQKLLAEHPD